MNRGKPENPLYGFTTAPVKPNHGFISVPLVVYQVHAPPRPAMKLQMCHRLRLLHPSGNSDSGRRRGRLAFTASLRVFRASRAGAVSLLI
jgi:hypothetical protein